LETLERRELLHGGGFLFTPLAPDVALVQQQQAHLSIRVNGLEQAIPPQLGVGAAGNLPVHTGDGSGWIHLDSPVPYTFHLQDIFTTWGQPFSPTQVLGYQADDSHPLTVEVNKQPTADWGDLVLRNSDEIVIRYGARGPNIDADAATNSYLGDWVGNTGQPFTPAGPARSFGTGTLPPALSATSAGAYTSAGPLTGPGPQADLDPAVPGPYATTRQQYNFGNQAFKPTDTAFASGVELAGEITAPTDLNAFSSPLPVVVLLHGRHVTLYDPSTGNVFLNWPPNGTNRLSIPSYQGYQYLEDNLASHGYAVLSVSANGINAFDNGTFDLGALARAQLMQRSYDILHDLNTGTGVVQTRTGLSYGTDISADMSHPNGFNGPSAPFGTRYVGKLDLQNIGIMGHSRGGEGVVRSFVLNQSLGSPYGIKAVLPLAPVDFNRTVINGVPLEVILPYDDGDVNDLQGVHFYDDALYNQPGDQAPKFTDLVNGADHNFFNTIWSPGGFAGGGDDSGYPADLRLTQAQERAVGLDYMAGFLRTFVGNATVPVATGFLPMLRGDVPPPASALTSQVFIGYEGPNTPAFRRDVNTERLTTNTATNTLGGAVLTSPLATGTGSGITVFDIRGSNPSLPPLPGQSLARQPHQVPSARSSAPGLNLLRLQWTNTFDAFYENDLPAGSRDVSGYYDLTFRASTVYDTPQDNRNKPNLTLDFSVTLTDGSGNSATALADNFTRSLYYPFGPDTGNVVPRVLLNSVRIPLGAFAGVNLTDVRSVRFNFDQKPDGYVLLADLAFEDPSTLYAGPFVVASGPAVAATTTSSFHVQFNTAINPGTFTPDQVQIVGPGNTPVAVTDIVATPGSNNSAFDILFAPLGAFGTYSVTVGPNVQDVFGHPMDQDFNGVAGEASDVYTTTFAVRGARVLASDLPASTLSGLVSSVYVTFNTSMDPATFTAAQVQLRGPGGVTIATSGGIPVDGSNDTQFLITFAPLTTLGVYTLTLGPNIRDPFGHAMDQNDNLVPGEIPGDQFVVTTTVHGPRIIASTPSGTILDGPVSSVRVTFNTSMNPDTFTPDQVQLTAPGGASIPVAVAAVDGSNNTQFLITFAPQTASGQYILTVGPNVLDTSGTPMDQNDNFTPGEVPGDQFASSFTIVHNYTATFGAAQNLEIHGTAGTQAVTFSQGGVTADDDYGIINLGGNTFTLYGKTYSQLAVGSNGLITFGGHNNPGTDAAPSNLVNFPPFATLAVYWTDLLKTGSEPMIEWKIVNDQLIIEWYNVTTFDGSPQMTFQVVLDLNTGGQSGDILLNYQSVTGTGDGPENLGVTVGVKDAGTGAGVPRTLIEDGTVFSSTGDPRVQTGKAIRLHMA
jgi:hypothetical protein